MVRAMFAAACSSSVDLPIPARRRAGRASRARRRRRARDRTRRCPSTGGACCSISMSAVEPGETGRPARAYRWPSPPPARARRRPVPRRASSRRRNRRSGRATSATARRTPGRRKNLRDFSCVDGLCRGSGCRGSECLGRIIDSLNPAADPAQDLPRDRPDGGGHLADVDRSPPCAPMMTTSSPGDTSVR